MPLPTAAAVCAHLQELEERLLKPEIRRNPQELNLILADGFREFGSSGRVYSKVDILPALAAESSRQLTLMDFQCEFPAPGVALVTYRSTSIQNSDPPVQALRCSLWVQRENRWQMLFHQGTRTGQTAA